MSNFVVKKERVYRCHTRTKMEKVIKELCAKYNSPTNPNRSRSLSYKLKNTGTAVAVIGETDVLGPESKIYYEEKIVITGHPGEKIKPTLIAAIDPGLKGALALLDTTTEKIKVFDLPTRRYGTKTILNEKAISELIAPFAEKIKYLVIEDVSSMPNQGVASTFRFGFATGVLHGVVSALGIQILRAKPSVWKPALGLSKDKNLSLALAKDFFPHAIEKFKLVKHNDRAEAALMAYFAWFKLDANGPEKSKIEIHQEKNFDIFS